MLLFLTIIFIACVLRNGRTPSKTKNELYEVKHDNFDNLPLPNSYILLDNGAPYTFTGNNYTVQSERAVKSMYDYGAYRDYFARFYSLNAHLHQPSYIQPYKVYPYRESTRQSVLLPHPLIPKRISSMSVFDFLIAKNEMEYLKMIQ